MGSRAAERVALMSIHPHYAEAILKGTKRIEFRKRALACDVRTVVVYATAPVKAIVGEFTIDDIVVATPTRLWNLHGSVGGIDRSSYREYYAGSTRAAGILVKASRRYKRPVPLAELSPMPTTPQSFSYLPAGSLDQVRALARGDRSLLARVADSLGHAVKSAVPSRPRAAIIPMPTNSHDVDRPVAAQG